ncbi:MAG: Gfo/Idh/MocA family protein [Rhodothermaceae bacterium]
MINKTRISLKRNKIKWGVAGCGKYLENSFLPALEILKKSKLTSVYSKSQERAKFIAEKFSAANAFSDFEEFLQSNFDVLYISSSNPEHYLQVIQAAKAGKHILCEKPLAVTSKQAAEMVETCKNNNVILTINYKFRSHPLIKKIKELITNDYLGPIVSIYGSFNVNQTPDESFADRGAAFDLATHIIDLFRYLGGEIDDIKGFCDNIVYNSSIEDFSNGIVKFDKSGYGYFQVSYDAVKAFNRIEVIGHKGSVCIEDLFGNRNGSARLILNLPGGAKKTFRRRVNAQLFQLKEFQKRFAKQEAMVVSGEDGLINLRLMEKLIKK